MRTLPSVLMVILVALFISVPSAGAATMPTRGAPSASTDDPIFQFCWFPGPSGWTRVGHSFHSCADCREVGDAGVSRGDWPEYRCGYFPVGLDVVYYLYVPPTR